MRKLDGGRAHLDNVYMERLRRAFDRHGPAVWRLFAGLLPSAAAEAATAETFARVGAAPDFSALLAAAVEVLGEQLPLDLARDPVDEALAEVPLLARAALVLRLDYALDDAALARLFGWPPAEVRRAIADARRRLRARWPPATFRARARGA
jgi:DNA-directed RNA polymerase specialized sigma24 family protein